jgi:hypothetical protein
VWLEADALYESKDGGFGEANGMKYLNELTAAAFTHPFCGGDLYISHPPLGKEGLISPEDSVV